MLRSIAAVVLLIASASAYAQGIVSAAPAVPDLSYASPLPGTWSYRAVPGGSEATFYNRTNAAQVTLHCTRGSRSISIAKAASAAAPYLSVWTSSTTRSLPAGFTPGNAQLTATLSAFDPLFDGMVFSRGRVGFVVAGTPPLVVPSWGEIGRVVEDCRA